MPFPNYPDPAQRALMLEAHLLRLQGLTYRQIGQRMDRSVSTVHSYVHDFEQFRTDVIAELAADQIVAHLVHLADLDDPHHDRRLLDIRELRLLLTALPTIRHGEMVRTMEILQSGVTIDRYGNRFPKPDRRYPATPEELAQAEQAPRPSDRLQPDQPLAYLPEPARTQPNATEPPQPAAPRPDAGPRPPSASNGASVPTPQTPQPSAYTSQPARTQPNASEQEIASTPAHNGRSPTANRKSAPPEPLDSLISETLELFPHLKGQSDQQILNALEQFTDPRAGSSPLDFAHGTPTDQGADPIPAAGVHADARPDAGAAHAPALDHRTQVGARAIGLAALPG